MGIKDFFRGDSPSFLDYEIRSSLENPQTTLSFPAEWLLDIYNGGRTDAGIRVSQLTAIQTVVVKRCVELIASVIASTPLYIYERGESKTGHPTRRIAYDHDLFDLISAEPNPEMTHKTMMETHVAQALLWGNAFIEIERNLMGDPIGLWPRNPGKTRPYRVKQPITVGGELLGQGTLVYVTTDGIVDYDESEKDGAGLSRSERIVLSEDMIHLPGLSLDGRVGLDVIEYARQTIGRKLAMEKFGSKFFGNGGRTSMIIKLPGNLSKENRDAARRSYQEALGGENFMRPIVLTSGVEIEPIEIKANEGQFIETENATKEELCALFGVPPHMLGMTDKTSRANTEQFALEFYQYCLGNWLVAIKQEFARKLLDKPKTKASRKFFFEFDIDSLIRPDSDTRQKFATAMFGIGAWSPNRALEYNGENPLDDPAADKTFVPVNMVELGSPPPDMNAPGNNPANPKVGNPQLPPAADGKSLTMDFGGGGMFHALPQILQERYVSIYLPLFKDAFQRGLSKKNPSTEVLYRTFAPVLTAISNDLLNEVARAWGVEKPDKDPLVGFVKDYVGSMEKRFASFTPESCRPELERAVTAACVVSARELAICGTQHAMRHLQLRDGSQPMGVPCVYLVEHGDTDVSVTGKMHGNNDASLNADGMKQAQGAADWLKAHVPAISAVYSSDLKRAVETAQPIAEAYSTKINQDHGLRPLKIGLLSGMDESSLKPYINHPDLTIPEGESVNDFIKRSPIFGEYLLNGNENRPTVVVLHSLNLAATTDSIEQDNPLASLLKTKAGIKPGGIVSVTRLPKGTEGQPQRYGIKIEY